MIPARSQSAVSRHAVLALSVLGCAGAAIVLFQFNPTEHAFYPVCIFHRLTGLECPGCGGTRAIYNLLHGHLLTALHFNALVVVSLPFVAVTGIRLFLREAAGQLPRPLAIRPVWIKILIAVVVGFTILRNIPYSPFTYLSPEPPIKNVGDDVRRL